MKLEDQVINLELAKRLKELGVEQDSLFYWIKKESPYVWYNSNNYPIKADKFYYSAFTVAELGELLPAYTNIDGDAYKLELSKYRIPIGDYEGEIRYSCEYWTLIGKSSYILGKGCYDTNEANARAQMLIYLLEEKLINAPIL